MSTRSHFIYNKDIEGYEETSEPQSIFGNFIGFNAYIFFSPQVLKSFEFKGEHLTLQFNENKYDLKELKIWGGNIIEASYDYEGLMVVMRGGGHDTKRVVGLLKGKKNS